MRKILIVDDDKAYMQAIENLLARMGFIVVTTTRGEEAIELANAFNPTLILLDLMLLGLDGRAVLNELKKDPVIKATPIVLMSAHPDGERIAGHAGAAGFLGKPVTRTTLVSTISPFFKKNPKQSGS